MSDEWDDDSDEDDPMTEDRDFDDDDERDREDCHRCHPTCRLTEAPMTEYVTSGQPRSNSRHAVWPAWTLAASASQQRPRYNNPMRLTLLTCLFIAGCSPSPRPAEMSVTGATVKMQSESRDARERVAIRVPDAPKPAYRVKITLPE